MTTVMQEILFIVLITMASLGASARPPSLVDAFADPVTGASDPMVDAWLASLCARVARAHLKQHYNRLDAAALANLIGLKFSLIKSALRE